MRDYILLRVIPADVETDIDGQRLQFRVWIASVSQLRLEQVHQFGIPFEGHADFIIKLQKVPDIIGISTFLEAIVRFQLAGDRFYLTEFVDVVFVRKTKPKICADGVFILVVLCSPVSILLQQWKDGTVANTLNTHDVGETRCNELAVKVYGICSKQSHAMQSDNPHSGFYEADTSRCLDRSGGNPSCNQGGMAVVAVQGSMIGRSDKNGPQGSGVNEDVSFTLDATDRHAVAYGIDRATYNMGRNAKFGLGIEEELEPTIVAKGPGAVAYCMTTGSYTQALEEQSPTLMARDYKDPPVVNETEPDYIVRRLTPTECARLQGFPDWWCSNLGTDEPTEEEIEFWTEVFETRRSVMGSSSKPKSRNQIIKWLKAPHSDSAEYKMWGNGVALPNVCFVLSGIVYYAQLSGE